MGDAKAAGAALEALAKKFPELPICVLAPGAERLSAISKVPKGSAVDAKAWLETLWPLCNGSGGGSAAKAQGSGKDVSQFAKVLSAANAFIN